MVGSEGTFGVITEMTLRLAGIPEAIAAATCPFPSVEAACNAAILTIQTGIPVARIELLDALQVKCFNIYSKLALPETPMLFLEFHGTEASVAEQSSDSEKSPRSLAVDRSIGRHARGPHPIVAGTARQLLVNRSLRPGTDALSSDVCVPISRLAQCVTETQRDTEENGFVAPMVGHVGDGNFHMLLLVDLKNPDEIKRAEELLERLVDRALAMDGTCTGEHGVGQGKMNLLESEHGEPALESCAQSNMRSIRSTS